MSVLTFNKVCLGLGSSFSIVWLLMLFFFVIFFCPGWRCGGIREEGNDPHACTIAQTDIDHDISFTRTKQFIQLCRVI